MTIDVLIVDDDKFVLDSIKLLLSKHYALESSCDSVDVLQRIRAGERFPLVLSDYKMPGMDGLELIAKIKEISPLTVCMLLTGVTDDSVAVQAMNLGHIFRYLTKPCSRESLITSIRDAIAHHLLLKAEHEFQQRLEMIVHGTNSATWDWDISSGSVRIDAMWHKLLGVDPMHDGCIPMAQLAGLVHTTDRRLARNNLVRHLTGRKDHFSCDIRMLKRNNAWRWMRFSGKASSLGATQRPTRMAGIMADINDEQEARRALADQLGFQNDLLDTLPNPIFVKNSNSCFVTCNRAYERAFGTNRGQLAGKTVTDMAHLQLIAHLGFQEVEQNTDRSPGKGHREVDVVFADGRVHTCLYWSSEFRYGEANSFAIVGSIVDITEQKRVERELAQKNRALEEATRKIEVISRTDHLTGLANRRSFMERLAEAASMAKRHAHTLSVIMADLDRFKEVNDHHGHAAGDKVLQAFASTLQVACRKEDLACRFGGEEFLVLLPMTCLREAGVIAERICSRMRGIDVLRRGRPVTVSLGVAEYACGETFENLLTRADQALYRAKRNGRDRVSV